MQATTFHQDVYGVCFDCMQNEIFSNGRVLRCTYKNEDCEPTGHFLASNIWFKNTTIIPFPLMKLKLK